MINVKSINSVSLQKTYEPNTIICRAGDTGGPMYVIIEGRVGVYKNYGEANQTMLTELKPGMFFNDRGFFLKTAHADTMVALSELKALVIEGDSIYKFFENNPEAVYSIIETLCGRIEKANTEYEKLRTRLYPKAQAEANAGAQEEPVSSLFPEGHKHYILRDPEVKKGLLRDEVLTCPMCNNKFSFPHIRTVVLRSLSMDSDLRRHYDGINTTHYLVATCPKCLFSTITDEFNKVSKKIRRRS